MKRFGYQLLELFHARQLVHVFQTEAHQEFFCGLVKNRTADYLLSSRGRDQLALQQSADDPTGIDSANIVNLGHRCRLLVSDHGQRLQSRQ